MVFSLKVCTKDQLESIFEYECAVPPVIPEIGQAITIFKPRKETYTVFKVSHEMFDMDTRMLHLVIVECKQVQ